MIFSRGKPPFKMLRQPSKIGDSRGEALERSLSIVEEQRATHRPVSLAYKLLKLASCLQQINMRIVPQPDVPLGESIEDAAKRYVDAAQQLTSQDTLVVSLEGLETLIQECCYYMNAGNMQTALLAIRRAVGIAQLMGLPSLSKNQKSRAEFIWFRIVYVDRQLSLILGVASGVMNDGYSSGSSLACNEPSEEMERLHVRLAGRIIARNVRLQLRERQIPQQRTFDDYRETQDIDHEIQKSTSLLPMSWWMAPTTFKTAPGAILMRRRPQLYYRWSITTYSSCATSHTSLIYASRKTI